MMNRYNPDINHRRSIRLQGYDYAEAGAYFVTICTYNREFIFGEITEGEMRLNDIGQVVVGEWLRTADVRKNVELDVFVVMPNHFHGIVVITGNGRGVLQYAPTANQTSLRSPSQTIGAIVRGFKSIATKRINIIRNTPGVPVWQRNYYEHIIRTEDELNRLREYIVNNPEQWLFDNENPDHIEQTNLGCMGEPADRPYVGF